MISTNLQLRSGHVATPWAGVGSQTQADVSTPGDQVSIGGGEVPATHAANAAEVGETGTKRTLTTALLLGVVVAGSLLTGCASTGTMMNVADTQVAQNVTGDHASRAFKSIEYLNNVYGGEAGGGFYRDKVEPDHRLNPLDALDRLLDSKTVKLKLGENGRAHEVRSFAELSGIESMVKDHIAQYGQAPTVLPLPR
ncbi:MAG: hypothetical protein FJX76_26890 [Armatimonadetes bacterium]|nr:hypothetical protein [Armatimonadota bacterium]